MSSDPLLGVLRAAALAGDDHVSMLAYADRLTDLDLLPEVAHAMRWCVARGVRPRLSAGGASCTWRRRSRLGGAFELDRVVFDQLSVGRFCSSTASRHYRTRRSLPCLEAAYADLAAALARTHEAWRATTAARHLAVSGGSL